MKKMKKISSIGALILLCLPILIEAQDIPSSPLIDSIQTELIKSLKNTEFYYRNGKATYAGSSMNLVDKPYYARLKNPEDVSINNGKVILTFKNKVREFSLSNNMIKLNTEYLIYFVPPIGQGYSNWGYLWGDLYFTDPRRNILDLQKQYVYQIKLKEINTRENYYNTELEKFKSLVQENKASSLTNQISEEQRKLIVQANALNADKLYSKAMEKYSEAVKINPLSYPQAYYNMALIAAQTNNYLYAIFNMNKYLIILPDAEDARAAQDKIYEWELKLN
jgi:tetratricopeptide (TPR) repeat protein